jgi:hypothetical protein
MLEMLGFATDSNTTTTMLAIVAAALSFVIAVLTLLVMGPKSFRRQLVEAILTKQARCAGLSLRSLARRRVLVEAFFYHGSRPLGQAPSRPL